MPLRRDRLRLLTGVVMAVTHASGVTEFAGRWSLTSLLPDHRLAVGVITVVAGGGQVVVPGGLCHNAPVIPE
jgi:hypothetical protein